MNDLLALYIFPFVLMSANLAFLGYTIEFRKYSILGIICIIISTVFLLVIRDPFAPPDSNNYGIMYNNQKNIEDIFQAYHKNYFFSLTQFLGNSLGLTIEVFLLVEGILCFLISFLGLSNIFQCNRRILMSLSFFVLTSTFVFLTTNVIRQGLAFSLVLLAIGFLIRNRPILAYTVLVLAIFSHFSALLIGMIIMLSKYVRLSNRRTIFILFLILLAPFLSMPLLEKLSSLDGILTKIVTFYHSNYDNHLVYFKMIVLYFCLLVFYFFGIRKHAFKNENYFFIFKIYFFTTFLIFFTSPVLLLSSRLLYYANGLLPILFTYILYHRPNFLNVQTRFYFGILACLLLGYFVYNFNSVKLQLGI